ncbi:MutH/Sau3AI family endonuclease [Pendulispora albinea]|uniref:DNA mismatch repair protein MutH n=1 Tax=Pendulispora albinea TaxID=2741071 RepID=A0ABZ2LXN6_9BACT
MKSNRAPPPRDEHELRVRALCLAGRTLGDLARELRFQLGDAAVHTKGKAGELVERALGAGPVPGRASLDARADPGSLLDFPHLGIELKTVPVDDRGKPRESTFVCALPLGDADAMEWQSSWVRTKLSHVLWLPILTREHAAWDERVLLEPVFWRPSRDQEAVFAGDFDDAMGIIASGGIERLTARTGRWLQVRPKAAHGRARTLAHGPEGEPIATVPRGFYLRTRFTDAILRDPTALPT